MPDKIQEYITQLVYQIAGNITAIKSISPQKEGSQWRILLDFENPDIFLEDSYKVLSSLQHIIRVLTHKKYPLDRTHFFFDIGNFRKAREKVLQTKIPELIHDQVIRDGKTLILINLTGYERLQVHTLLADIASVSTSSVGQGAARKLLIMPASEVGAFGIEKAITFDINNNH